MWARAPACHFCRACRSAAVIFSPEIVHESCHGKCREISGEILLLLVPQETKLENAQNLSRQISRRFSRDVLQLQMRNFMGVFHSAGRLSLKLAKIFGQEPEATDNLGDTLPDSPSRPLWSRTRRAQETPPVGWVRVAQVEARGKG